MPKLNAVFEAESLARFGLSYPDFSLDNPVFIGSMRSDRENGRSGTGCRRAGFVGRPWTPASPALYQSVLDKPNKRLSRGDDADAIAGGKLLFAGEVIPSHPHSIEYLGAHLLIDLMMQGDIWIE